MVTGRRERGGVKKVVERTVVEKLGAEERGILGSRRG